MERVKRACIISFDLIRPGEPEGSLAIASLLAYLKQDAGYGQAFVCEHVSFNLLDNPQMSLMDVLHTLLASFELPALDFIALSCYVWSECLVNPVIHALRSRGFAGAIILGGYQISYEDSHLLQQEYPDCQVFLKGYAEESLRQALLNCNLDIKLFIFFAIPLLIRRYSSLSSSQQLA